MAGIDHQCWKLEHVSIGVTILGSSAMYATTERACAGYLIKTEGRTLWLDAGAGTWRNLLQHVDFTDLDGIVLTHRHPDHTSDAFQCFHARRYGGPEPLPQIPLWAPEETIECMMGYAQGLEESFHINPVSPNDTVTTGDAILSFTKMAHPVDTLGVRIESDDGSTFAYSSDSGPDADFAALAGGAGLFICEATFQDSDEEWEGHMSAAQAGGIAAEVGVGELVLTHLPAGRDLGLSIAEAERTASTVKVRLAADGLRLDA